MNEESNKQKTILSWQIQEACRLGDLKLFGDLVEAYHRLFQEELHETLHTECYILYVLYSARYKSKVQCGLVMERAATLLDDVIPKRSQGFNHMYLRIEYAAQACLQHIRDANLDQDLMHPNEDETEDFQTLVIPQQFNSAVERWFGIKLEKGQFLDVPLNALLAWDPPLNRKDETDKLDYKLLVNKHRENFVRILRASEEGTPEEADGIIRMLINRHSLQSFTDAFTDYYCQYLRENADVSVLQKVYNSCVPINNQTSHSNFNPLNVELPPPRTTSNTRGRGRGRSRAKKSNGPGRHSIPGYPASIHPVSIHPTSNSWNTNPQSSLGLSVDQSLQMNQIIPVFEDQMDVKINKILDPLEVEGKLYYPSGSHEKSYTPAFRRLGRPAGERKRWTTWETVLLLHGVSTIGRGKWKDISEALQIKGRSQVDLKDRYRNVRRKVSSDETGEVTDNDLLCDWLATLEVEEGPGAMERLNEYIYNCSQRIFSTEETKDEDADEKSGDFEKKEENDIESSKLQDNTKEVEDAGDKDEENGENEENEENESNEENGNDDLDDETEETHKLHKRRRRPKRAAQKRYRTK